MVHAHELLAFVLAVLTLFTPPRRPSARGWSRTPAPDSL